MDEINKLYNSIETCSNWTNKLDLISQLQIKINNEEEIINNKIDSLDNLVKVSKKKINFDLLLEEFDITKELDKKIQIYQQLNSYINKLNNELFTN
jgi:hypothetical protein